MHAGRDLCYSCAAQTVEQANILQSPGQVTVIAHGHLAGAHRCSAQEDVTGWLCLRTVGPGKHLPCHCWLHRLAAAQAEPGGSRLPLLGPYPQLLRKAVPANCERFSSALYRPEDFTLRLQQLKGRLLFCLEKRREREKKYFVFTW